MYIPLIIFSVVILLLVVGAFVVRRRLWNIKVVSKKDKIQDNTRDITVIKKQQHWDNNWWRCSILYEINSGGIDGQS